MSAAVSIQRSSTDASPSSALDTWRMMEKNAFPGAETLVRNTPTHPQPEFISIASGGGSSDQPSSSSSSRHLTGQNTAMCMPWVQKDYPSNMVGLHEEILHFNSYISPRRYERYMRLQVVQKIKQIILGLWTNAQVYEFGSLCTGLYLPTSDIDIVVFGDWLRLPLFSLEDAIVKSGIAVEDSIVVLDKTTVPIIKFTDKATEVKVDISFNRDGGLKAAQLIMEYIREFPLLPPLLMVVKQFLVQRQLNEIYFGGINSYSLVLMLVSFFQHHARNEATEPTANLGVLLLEFFELYGRQFNYTKVGISLIGGGCYFPKEALENGMEDSLLYIQDPIDQQENACRGCYGIMQVKTAFEHAFSTLHKAVLVREEPTPRTNTLLGAIIQIREEVDQYRKWVESEWSALSMVASPPPFTMATPTLFSPIALIPQSYVIHQQNSE